MVDDFSDHPKSIAEIRADRAHDAALWTPRDALISALRDIDSGDWKPESLIIYAVQPKTEQQRARSRWYAAGIRDDFHALGMLTAAIKEQE